jgi:hypothetical protein
LRDGIIVPAVNPEEGKMRKSRAIVSEDLEHMIETKILEILGDPDAGLEYFAPDPQEQRKFRNTYEWLHRIRERWRLIGEWEQTKEHSKLLP